jgi:hypothetical protein
MIKKDSLQMKILTQRKVWIFYKKAKKTTIPVSFSKYNRYKFIIIIENIENIDIRKSSLRWCMLFMACMFMFGNSFCYDNPGPLEKQLE